MKIGGRAFILRFVVGERGEAGAQFAQSFLVPFAAVVFTSLSLTRESPVL